MRSWGEIARKAFGYGVFDLINKGLPFLLLPFLTRWLTPEQFGVVAVFQLCWQMSVLLCQAGGQGQLSVAFIKDGASTYETLKYRVVCNSFFIATFATLGGVIVSLITGELLWVLLSVSGCGGALVSFFLAECQASKKVLAYGKVQLLLTLANLALTFLLVFFMAEKGRVLAFLIPSILVSVYVVKAWGLKNIRLKLWTIELKLGLGIFIHQTVNWSRYSVDKFILVALLGSSMLGEYQANFQLAFSMSVMVSVLNRAFMPYVFEALKNEGGAFSLFLLQVVVVSIMAVVAYFLILWLGAYMLGDGYSLDGLVILLLICAFWAQGLYMAMAHYFYFFEKTKVLGLLSLGCGGFMVLGAFVFVPMFQGVGAALSTFTSMLLLLFAVYVGGNKLGIFPWNRSSAA